MSKFIIFSLPRSRTAWLSRFLTYGGKTCGHDLAVTSDGIEDFLAKISQVDGTIETGAVIGHKLIRENFPNASIIVLRRSVGEVIHSLVNLGIDFNPEEIHQRANLLDNLSEEVGVHTIRFDSLRNEMCCGWLFCHCLRLNYSHDWWDALKDINIQIDMKERLNLLHDRREIIEEMKARCAA